jgi:hypothetical protein
VRVFANTHSLHHESHAAIFHPSNSHTNKYIRQKVRTNMSLHTRSSTHAHTGSALPRVAT